MTVTVCRTIADFRAAGDRVRRVGGNLGLVPTMGALHAGHLALVAEARRRATVAAVTIFVNPTQFGPQEDYARYPRDLEADLARCADSGAEIVFAPAVEEMYPAGEVTRVSVPELSAHLCGASRPGHLEGVSTIVAKLFAVAGPCVAVFGRKDYQQLKVVERMVRDLLLPVEIVGYPTVREADGLALSSRNAYLAPDDRRRALAIPRALAGAVRRFDGGERRVGRLRLPVREQLEQAGHRVDYVAIADADRITPWGDDVQLEGRALLAVASFVGAARLIDNVVFTEDSVPVAEAP